MPVRVLSKSEYKFDANQHGGRMATLDDSGAFAFSPTCCKEEFYYSVAKNTAFYKNRNHLALDVMLGDPGRGKINRKRPRFVYFVGKPNIPAIKKIAERVLKIMTLLCERMELDEPEVAYTQDGCGIVVTLPRIFIRSPYATSAALTFIRSASQTVFSFDTLGEFVDVMSSDKTTSDGLHLMRAIVIHNSFDDFLAKELPCMKRRGFESYRRGTVSNDCAISMHGIGSYSRSVERTYEKLTMKVIKELYHV